MMTIQKKYIPKFEIGDKVYHSIFHDYSVIVSSAWSEQHQMYVYRLDLEGGDQVFGLECYLSIQNYDEFINYFDNIKVIKHWISSSELPNFIVTDKSSTPKFTFGSKPNPINNKYIHKDNIRKRKASLEEQLLEHQKKRKIHEIEMKAEDCKINEVLGQITLLSDVLTQY